MVQNESNQIDLFSQLSKEKSTTDYLFIIKDNKKVSMDIEDLFNLNMFDEFYAITYVSSPSFFSKYAKGFNKISFILGIDDSENLEKFTKGLALKKFLDIDTRVEFWNSLDEELKDKIVNRKLDIRFGQIDVVIHDKIYLLRSSISGQTRVIIGSSNFTSKAFSNKEQFENIRIDDNNEALFNYYFTRFNEVYKFTYDFIPDRCRTTYQTDKVLIVSDGEISKDILLDELKKYEGKLLIEEQHIEEIKGLCADVEYKKENIDRTDNVLSLITQKRNGKYKIKPVSEIEKKAISIKTAFCRTNKESNNIDERPNFIYNKSNNKLMRGSSDSDVLDENYSVKADAIKIKENLEKVNKFIEAYNIFAVNPCLENQSKVFEILLYSFTAPFIWKIRDSHVLDRGIDSVRSSFPPFMIIGGVAKSGKTTALEFAALLLGDNKNRYFEYAKEISKAGVIFDYFNTENVFPLFVDEIEPNFFYKSITVKKGEALIKHVSNSIKGCHPVLIGTTNLREFSANSQVLRRIYYLEINNVFDDNKKSESQEYLNEIISDVDDSLFRDFSFRLGQTINDMDKFYTPDDVLYKARGIFKAYYNECEMKLPEWFPKTTFNDYEARKVIVWSNMFNAHRQYFKENEKGTIYVYIDEIFKNNKSKKEKDTTINFLDDTCIIENNAILELDKEKFYEFIRYKEKPTLIKKVFNSLGLSK